MSYQENHPNYRELEVSDYTSGRLKLAEPKLEHAEKSLKWTSDLGVIQYMGTEFGEPSINKEQERISEIRKNLDEYNWMIELNGQAIGNVSINSIAETTKELGEKAGQYSILIGDKNYWRKGIAKQVSNEVNKWALPKVISKK
ncbi:GNAT family N-acetyltransferase [Candidatus Peregrinibacteria bacterium]|nr:MAG: GNAT family N-acetyltransferase [Candidatus Peregrinibacteria bacterium]